MKIGAMNKSHFFLRVIKKYGYRGKLLERSFPQTPFKNFQTMVYGLKRFHGTTPKVRLRLAGPTSRSPREHLDANAFSEPRLKFLRRFLGRATAIQRACVGRPSQRAKSLILPKRHERVNFGVAERGKTHKWGFSLPDHLLLLPFQF